MDTLQVLASVLRTCRQQHRDPVGILVPPLTGPTPIVADLVIPGRPDPRRGAPGLIVPARATPPQRPEPELPQPGRYRMVVTERKDPHATTVVLGADGDALVAAIGYARDGRLTAQQGHGGTSEHVHDLAHLIADTLLH